MHLWSFESWEEQSEGLLWCLHVHRSPWQNQQLYSLHQLTMGNWIVTTVLCVKKSFFLSFKELNNSMTHESYSQLKLSCICRSVQYEARCVSAVWGMWTVPVLWVLHAVGGPARCTLLPCSVAQPALQQQRPLPLSTHPHLPLYWVGTLEFISVQQFLHLTNTFNEETARQLPLDLCHVLAFSNTCQHIHCKWG